MHKICGHQVDIDPADINRASGIAYCHAEHAVDDR